MTQRSDTEVHYGSVPPRPGIDPGDWAAARRVTRAALRSSLHCAIATTNADGTAHVTPIGSVMLSTEAGRGVYFDVFNARLARNLQRNPRVTVLAVDSRVRTWLWALAVGRFDRPPGMRLVGTAGPRRKATDDEIRRWRRAVGPLLRTRGGRYLWEGVEQVRDLEFEDVLPVRLGEMTSTR